VTTCAVALRTVNVATPDAFVVALAGEIVEVPPALCASVTVLPLTAVPDPFLSVTVIVEAVVPSAATLVGLADTVDVEAETTDVKVTVGCWLSTTPSPVAV
jgi:hypothetical protein